MVHPTPTPSTLLDPPQPPAFACPSPDTKRSSKAWYTLGKPSFQLPARISGDAASRPTHTHTYNNRRWGCGRGQRRYVRSMCWEDPKNEDTRNSAALHCRASPQNERVYSARYFVRDTFITKACHSRYKVLDTKQLCLGRQILSSAPGAATQRQRCQKSTRRDNFRQSALWHRRRKVQSMPSALSTTSHVPRYTTCKASHDISWPPRYTHTHICCLFE